MSRQLIVSRHAVAAYSRRCKDDRSLRLLTDIGWNLDDIKRVYGPDQVGELVAVYNELEREIANCVSYALENNLALKRKPKGFALYGSRKSDLPEGQRFVRCSEDADYGFIVKREPGGGADVVMTAVTRTGS